MINKILTFSIILLFVGVVVQPAIAKAQQGFNFNDDVKQSLNNRQGECLSLSYGDLWILLEKMSIHGFHGHRDIVTYASYHYYDADLDELQIELILNYTVVMNYTLKLPFYFAPIIAIGIEIQNVTECEWEYFKLKHYGYFNRSGNVTIKFNIDLTSVESGDEIIIQPILYSITIPYIGPSDNPKDSLLGLVRLIYIMPILNELLLTNWLFPILGGYGYNTQVTAPIFLFFE
jgi:hypothetical protein